MKQNTVIMTMEDFADMRVKEPQKKWENAYKDVIEYSLEGVFIRTFSSAAEAARFHRVQYEVVGACCRGTRMYSAKTNTIFLYRGDDISERLGKIKQSSLEPSKNPHGKEVYEYTLNGRFIAKYPTAVQAASANKVKPLYIRNCCEGKRRIYIDKRIFLYKDGDIKQRVKEVKAELYKLSKKRPLYREVDEYTLEGEFVKGYPSASAASRELNIHVSDITRCCNGGDKHYLNKYTTKGRIFLWVGDSISDRLEQIKQNKK